MQWTSLLLKKLLLSKYYNGIKILWHINSMFGTHFVFQVHTVLKETKHTRPSVWSKIGSFQIRIKYLKSLNRLAPKRYESD